MSLVSALTRESSRNHRHESPPGVALAGIPSGGEPAPRSSRPDSEALALAPAGAAARRIAAGHVGDPLALDRYVERARRGVALSLGAGGVMALLAVAVGPLGGLPAMLLLLGAGLDWARARRGARVLVQGGVLVIRRGPWGGARLRRTDIESIDIDIDSPAPSRSGVEAGAAYLVVLRLKGDGPLRLEGSGPRRLIVPEAGAGEARAAALRLQRWWSSART